jgi:hypothetical protein
MRNVWTWFAGLLIGLALATTGNAQQPKANSKDQPPNVIGAELTAINHCVREVRESTPGSSFDAHVGRLGTMRFLGTEAEIAAFKRCMQVKGFPGDLK